MKIYHNLIKEEGELSMIGLILIVVSLVGVCLRKPVLSILCTVLCPVFFIVGLELNWFSWGRIGWFNGWGIFDGWDGLIMIGSIFVCGFLAFIASVHEDDRRDREYLNSLPPDERAQVIETRARAFIEFQRREEQRKRHEEQLRRDLEIIDKHYRKN